MSAKHYHLIVLQGPKTGHIFPLTLPTLTIGRDPIADIVLTDPEVSRQHVRLTRTEAGYEIQDLGSTNGSFLNGQRLGGAAVLLKPEQEIVLGSGVMLRYGEHEGDDLPLPLRETAVPEPPAPAFRTLIDDDEEDEEEDGGEALPPVPDPLGGAADLTDALEQLEDELDAYDPFLSDEAPVPAAPAGSSPKAKAALPPAAPAARPAAAPRAASRPAKAAPLVPPASGDPGDQKRRRVITWIVVSLLLIICCCCAFLLSAYYLWGDPLMEALGVY